MKPRKDIDAMKYKISIPFLPEEVPVEGELLGKVPQLCMEDCDFNDHIQYPQFETRMYLHCVYYESTRVIRAEPMRWVAGIQNAGL